MGKLYGNAGNVEKSPNIALSVERPPLRLVNISEYSFAYGLFGNKNLVGGDAFKIILYAFDPENVAGVHLYMPSLYAQIADNPPHPTGKQWYCGDS